VFQGIKTMPDTVLQFYQQLARDYHLIFADWTRAIERQGNALDRLIRSCMTTLPAKILDCSCGIGTQAIALAQHGYTVHATDLSQAAVERAAKEAAAFGVSITFGVADFRMLAQQVDDTFDVVLSCDNALPHLLDDADLLLAAQNMYAKLNDHGLLLISMRDYDQALLDKPHTTAPVVYDEGDQRRVVFQVWDWSESGQTYTVTLFIITRENGAAWETHTFSTTYRALQRAELNTILEQAGFADIRWHMPQDTGYSQPMVTARRFT
jgi:SAM-dependent methyltransferase